MFPLSSQGNQTLMSTKKRQFTILMGLMLIGCTSNLKSEQLMMLADYRSSVISSILPFKMKSLTLIQAKPNLNMITLVFIKNGTTNITGLLKKVTRQYCQDIETRNLLDKGISYQVIFLNEKKQKENEIVINLQSCIH